MSTDALLDELLVPRPSGSDGLEQAGRFIETTLQEYTPLVSLDPFAATPYGFQLPWVVAFILISGGKRYPLYDGAESFIPVVCWPVAQVNARFWIQSLSGSGP